MNDSVNDRDGDITIKEELSPLREFLVRHQDDRSVFIHGVNQLKQIVHAFGCLCPHRHVGVVQLADIRTNAIFDIASARPIKTELAIMAPGDTAVFKTR